MAKGAAKKRVAGNAGALDTLLRWQGAVMGLSVLLSLWSWGGTLIQWRGWLLLQAVSWSAYGFLCSHARLTLGTHRPRPGATPGAGGGSLDEPSIALVFDLVYLCWLVLLLGPPFPKAWYLFLLIPAYGCFKLLQLVGGEGCVVKVVRTPPLIPHLTHSSSSPASSLRGPLWWQVKAVMRFFRPARPLGAPGSTK